MKAQKLTRLKQTRKTSVASEKDQFHKKASRCNDCLLSLVLSRMNAFFTAESDNNAIGSAKEDRIYAEYHLLSGKRRICQILQI